MYIVLLGWLYVALLAALAQATSSNGSVLGAIGGFLFYGLLPMGLLAYVLSTPARKRAIKAREKAELEIATGAAAPTPDAASSVAPDASDHATGCAVAPMREEN